MEGESSTAIAPPPVPSAEEDPGTEGEEEEMPPLPDFKAFAEAHKTIAKTHTTLANYAKRIGGIPDSGRGEQFTRAIRDITDEVQELKSKVEALMHNNIARLANSFNGTFQNNSLMPLRNDQNEDVDGFPATEGHLSRLDSPPLDTLLEAYELPSEGTKRERKDRLRIHIGVMMKTRMTPRG